MTTLNDFYIISGGQTGIDELGLQLAKGYGIPTGGWMPPNFLTETGPRPDFEALYGMKVMPDGLWAKRTRYNVLDSDATAIFGNTNSGGTRSTINFCIKYNKPHIVNPSGEELLAFVLENDISTLNIAGNKGSILSPEDRRVASESLHYLFTSITNQK